MKKKIIAIGILGMFLLLSCASLSAVELKASVTEKTSNKNVSTTIDNCGFKGFVRGYVYGELDNGETIALEDVPVTYSVITSQDGFSKTTTTDENGYYSIEIKDWGVEYMCHLETDNVEREGHNFARVCRFTSIDQDEANQGFKEVNLIMPEGINSNQKPNPPTINGPTVVMNLNRYDYTYVTTDPDDEEVEFFICKLDGGLYHHDWIGPYASDEESNPDNLIWGSIQLIPGYIAHGKLRVIARDSQGAISEWSEIDVTIMPRNRVVNIPFFNFLQQHPILYQLFQRLLNL